MYNSYTKFGPFSEVIDLVVVVAYEPLPIVISIREYKYTHQLVQYSNVINLRTFTEVYTLSLFCSQALSVANIMNGYNELKKLYVKI